MKTNLVRLALALVLLAAHTACSKKPAAPAEQPEVTHVHAAPHGGTLIELGEHRYHIELVRDPAAGTLTAYILDAHAEHFVRLTAPAISLTAKTGDATHTLLLAATANPASGETVGDTSQFTAQADWLKTTPAFDFEITDLQIRDSRFPRLCFRFPSP